MKTYKQYNVRTLLSICKSSSSAGEKYEDLFLSGTVTMVTHNICANGFL